MTAGELLAQIRNQLDEEVEGFFKDEELYDWMEEGHKEVARRAKHLTSRSYIDPTDDSEYKLPDDFIEARKVKYDKPDDDEGGKWLRSIPMEDDGFEMGYYIWGDSIYLSQLDEGRLTLYYYRLPDRILDGESKEPEIPMQYETILIPFVMGRAFMKDKKSKLSQINMQEYKQRVMQMKKNMDRRALNKSWTVKRR